MAYQKLTPIVATGATAPRYLSDRFADMVNVRDFGAKADGTTDDTSAFQAAAAAASGKAVFVPQGSYKVTDSVSGFFVSDGYVDANASYVEVWSIQGNHDNIELLEKALTLSSPSQQKNFPNYMSLRGTDYYFQSICYDSYRERFVLGAENTDNSLKGYLYALTDLFDTSTVAVSKDIYGGHFNDMSYDVKNDAIYLCPGSAQENKLLVVNPSTLEISEEWTITGTPWQCAVNGDYVYLIISSTIYRYNTTTKTKDAAFSIPLKTIKVASNESVTGQGSFFVGDVFVMIWNVSDSDSGWRRCVYSCYDIKTKKSVNTGFNVYNIDEIEGADIKDGVLYQISASAYNLKFYITPTGVFHFQGGAVRKVPNSSDLNSFTTEGDYIIQSGASWATCQNRPMIDYGCGMLHVKNICSSGRLLQHVENGGQVDSQRVIDVESGDVSDWHQPGYTVGYESLGSDDSIDSRRYPGLQCFSNIGGLPEGSNGWIQTFEGHKNTTKVYKQLYFRWGTANTTDHSLYERFIIRDTSTSSETVGSWVKVITGKDSFPNNFVPSANNTYSLGNSYGRWTAVYATSGSINTSDERVKDNIESPEASLLRAWGNVGFKVFQFKDSIEKKGSNARIHVGVVAQEVSKAFSAEGIDASRYGLFCYDEWDEKWEEDTVVDEEAVLDENGEVVVPEKTHVARKKIRDAGNSYGIRYEEALALECAYLRSRIAKMQEQMDQLVATVAQLTSQQNN